MSINALIAQGNTGNKTPYQRHMEGRMRRQTENVNALNMESTRQAMGQRQKAQQNAQEDRKSKIVADIFTALGNDPDNAQTIGARGEAFYKDQTGEDFPKDPQVAKMMAARGGWEPKQAYTDVLGPNGNVVGQRGSDNKLTAVDMTGSAPVERVMPAGVNNQGQNLVVTRLYQGNKIIEESQPYVKKEVERTSAIDPSDLTTNSQKGKQQIAWQDKEISLRNTVQGIDEVINLVSSPDFQGGLTGDMYSISNSIVAQYHQARGSVNFITDGKFDEKKLKLSKERMGRFKRAAHNNDRTDSAILELAFVLAKDLNNDGKISDADVRQAEKILSSGGDATSIINVLRDNQARALRKFNNAAKVKGKKSLTMSDITGKTEPVDPALDASNMTIQEQKDYLEALKKIK